MKIYLDDNRVDKSLIAMLGKEGHHVTIPSQVGLSSERDARHLAYAIKADLVLLTADRQDFRDLHDLVVISGGEHPGILVLRFDNDPRKDMRPKHILFAIGKLLRSEPPLRSQFIVLNQWR